MSRIHIILSRKHHWWFKTRRLKIDRRKIFFLPPETLLGLGRRQEPQQGQSSDTRHCKKLGHCVGIPQHTDSRVAVSGRVVSHSCELERLGAWQKSWTDVMGFRDVIDFL